MTSTTLIQPLLPLVCQRWRHHRDSYRPAGELINPDRHRVEVILDSDGRKFVETHHYARAYVASRFRVGLFRKEPNQAERLRLRHAVADTERVLAERRERSHGTLANRILALGTLIQSETLSYTAFQKCFGRSTKVRGVGVLMSRIRRKAARAGGAFRDLNTQRLKLSQYDHLTHTYTKIPLRERWHVLGDGSGVVQRDLYSAFLASVAETDVLHPRRAQTAWPTAQSLLGRAGWRRTEPVSVASVLATAPGLPTPERVARQRALARGKPSDAVGHRREPKRPAGSGPRTPRR